MPPVEHSFYSLAIVLGTFFFATPVVAQPKKFSLNWVREAGAESCIASHELANVIEQALGPLFVAPRDAELSIEARVRHLDRPPGWAARIVVSDRQGRTLGERQLSSSQASCRALDPQIELVIVLAIDPEVALEHLPVELLAPLQTEGDPAAELLAELQAEAKAVKQPAPAAVSPREPLPRARAAQNVGSNPHASAPPVQAPREARLTLGLGWAGGIEWLPKPSTGPLLLARLRLTRRWSIALHAIGWLRNDAQLVSPAPGGGKVHFHMALGSLSPCFEITRSRSLTWNGCGGPTVAVRWTEAASLVRTDHGSHWNFGPTLSSEISWGPLPRLVIALLLAAEVPLLRERFTYRDGQSVRELFAPGRVAPWVALAGGASF